MIDFGFIFLLLSDVLMHYKKIFLGCWINVNINEMLICLWWLTSNSSFIMAEVLKYQFNSNKLIIKNYN